MESLNERLLLQSFLGALENEEPAPEEIQREVVFDAFFYVRKVARTLGHPLEPAHFAIITVEQIEQTLRCLR
jgi:hypothetical protein